MPKKDSGERCYAVLFSIHFVIKAEKLLKAQNITYELSPIPRAIGSSCGMALEFPCHETQAIQELLTKADIEIIGLYQRTCDDVFVSIN
ncbi:MAG: DUF3343 domain-containing protein [Desulfobulbaceae bacterium]|nr:DUF3343 domain-containing protein [Desulfobulbaceae bacterium]